MKNQNSESNKEVFESSEDNNMSTFVKKLLNGELTPELIAELFKPTVENIKNLCDVLKAEIEANSKDYGKGIDAINATISTLENIVKSDVSDEQKEKANDAIIELGREVSALLRQKENNSFEFKKYVAKGVLFLIAIFGAILLGGKAINNNKQNNSG